MFFVGLFSMAPKSRLPMGHPCLLVEGVHSSSGYCLEGLQETAGTSGHGHVCADADYASDTVGQTPAEKAWIENAMIPGTSLEKTPLNI
jgi:hypothetical protein